MIDLSCFNLVTPEVTSDGEAVTYWPSNLPSNEYFSILDNGENALWAPTKGATTENSEKTRTEFREIVPGGTTLKNWKLGQYSEQYLRAALTLQQVTPNGRVCIGQIHVKDNNRPPIKLVWNNGKLRLMYRITYNQEADVGVTVLDSVPIGECFTYSIHVAPDGNVTVIVGHGTRSGTKTVQLDSSWKDKLLYFKAGLYNQEEATSLTLPTDGSRGVMYTLEVKRP
ncbi:polysaccharide lyase family 7 protein [Azotobacter salinestris]|uniref:polysaccharide lyase family 7 protein n=1 Tax=Azotobacter salinestris TaxID=69964 RepID=UPI0012669FF4|nr:polysaccharide lyase family 7 protein [Azotobacter salinestris]